MKRTFLTTALIASGAALLIAAGPKADLNQDGQVTQAEFTQTAMDRFAAADTNGDNFLSEDERKALRETRKDKRADRRFDKLDADKDGNISRAEMDAKRSERGGKRDAKKAERQAEMLKRFDTNLDGTLSESERVVMRAERDAKRAERKAERGEKQGDRKQRRAERPKPDANGDGFISLDEHLVVTEQLFARMDTNGDGVLEKGEGKKRKGRKGPKGERGPRGGK